MLGFFGPAKAPLCQEKVFSAADRCFYSIYILLSVKAKNRINKRFSPATAKIFSKIFIHFLHNYRFFEKNFAYSVFVFDRNFHFCADCTIYKRNFRWFSHLTGIDFARFVAL